MKKREPYTAEDLTMVICAYQECPELEKSIRSILRQTERPRILISTSTPNTYIQRLADQYHVPVRVNPQGGHVRDYNFAMRQVKTRLGMIAHQDDLLHRQFVEKSLAALNRASDPILSFTNYLEIVDGHIRKKPSVMIRVKRLLVTPMRVPGLRRTAAMKRLGQCLGNPIAHPSVICVMDRMPEELFREGYRATMDWDLWERLSREKGEFVYCPEVLLFHRMDKANATAQLIRSGNVVYEEELELMSRFWPAPAARLVMRAYSQSEKFY